MAGLLKEGQKLTTEAGLSVIVGRKLGGGGQGEVYAAEAGGQRFAVKWYTPTWIGTDPGLRDRLRKISRQYECPSPNFIWPIDVVSGNGIPNFGYLMPFREDRFRELDEVATGRISPSLRSRATAAIKIAEAFQKLHALGLCYRDISFGNIALDPDTAEMRICDNDNADENGVPLPMGGTTGFMAPEVVRKTAYPTRDTDLWSFAVLLFWMFIGQHPLLGRREHEHFLVTPSVLNALLGAEALFIFHPDDESNGPVARVHDGALRYWRLYPQALRDAFIRSFTRGILNPRQRVLHNGWRAVMGQLRDAILPCSHCGAENFHEKGISQRCWGCSAELPPPPYIELRAGGWAKPSGGVQNYKIVIAEQAALYPHHIGRANRADSQEPIARVVCHPEHRDVIGLENLGTEPWPIVRPDGQTDIIDPGQRVRIRSGLRIAFGAIEGVVT